MNAWINEPKWWMCGLLAVLVVVAGVMCWQLVRIVRRLHSGNTAASIQTSAPANNTRIIEWVICAWFFIGAIAIIAAIIVSYKNINEPTIVTVLSILITFLVAWQIWATINTNKIVERYDNRIRETENNITAIQGQISSIGGLWQSQNGINEAHRIINSIITDTERSNAHEYARAYFHSCDSLLGLITNQLRIEELINDCLTIMSQIIVNAQGILDNPSIALDVRNRLHQEFNSLNPMINNLANAIRRNDNNAHAQVLDDLQQRRQEIINWSTPS